MMHKRYTEVVKKVLKRTDFDELIRDLSRKENKSEELEEKESVAATRKAMGIDHFTVGKLGDVTFELDVRQNILVVSFKEDGRSWDYFIESE